MNAETSAWGRAIIALGFRDEEDRVAAGGRGTPGSGSRVGKRGAGETGPEAGSQEGGFQARRRHRDGGAPTPFGDVPVFCWDRHVGRQSNTVDRDNEGVPESWSQFATKEQRQELFELKRELGVSDVRLMEILEYVTGQKTTAAIPAELFDKVMENVQLEAVPFAVDGRAVPPAELQDLQSGAVLRRLRPETECKRTTLVPGPPETRVGAGVMLLAPGLRRGRNPTACRRAGGRALTAVVLLAVRLDLDNLVTLCRRHHHDRHRKGVSQ